ncbi:MAG: 6-carboxytetrahydropterin synthase [Saprospiraceae bacterium]|nr:6-carboxytetrahydropterin synthase [Saprospiraceae bacterium]
MLTISKEFHFSASHVLEGLTTDHPCSRLHGHNYIVKIILTGIPDSVGFIQDYRELEPIKKWIDDNWDHKHLNEELPTINPTAENMAIFLYTTFKQQFPKIKSVSISETPKTWATYEPQN